MGSSLLLQDLQFVPMDRPPESPLGDVRQGSLRIRSIVYSAVDHHVVQVLCGGTFAVRDGVLQHGDFARTAARTGLLR